MSLNRPRFIRCLRLLALAVAPLLFATGLSAVDYTYTYSSTPAGYVSQSGVAAEGTVVSTTSLNGETTGHTFAYWTLNGVRQADSSGRALPSVSFTLAGNTTVTAVYLPSGQDDDSDGLPDWFEQQQFGHLGNTSSSDPDADGISLNLELARGYSPTLQDTLRDGGISVRRSASLIYLGGTDLRYTITSNPPGFTSSGGVGALGSSVTTPTLNGETTGYTFAYWMVNGVRQADSSGRALPGVTFTLSATATATAVYLPGTEDTDADGLPDWFEQQHFGHLDNTPSSDPDADGIPLNVELARGYSPTLTDTIRDGGISVRRSASLSYLGGTDVRYSITSNPVGYVNQTGVGALGSGVTTPTLNGEATGYTFAYWTLNGVRQADGSGRALPGVSYDLIDTNELVAVYLPSGQDEDADGLPDWFEQQHFGHLDNTPSSDPDADGILLKVELSRGYSPTLTDTIRDGGISVRRSTGMVYLSTTTVIAPTVTFAEPEGGVYLGQSTTLAPTINGSGSMNYQWYEGTGGNTGNPVPGGTGSTLTIPSVSATKSYWLRASNLMGSVDSGTYTVRALTLSPAFSQQPVAQAVLVGTAATFTAAASGLPAPTYQWRKNGAAISGATGASYTLPAATSADAGTYSVVATNSVGSATSTEATLTVQVPPAITTQPQALTVVRWQSASLTVVATGNPAPTYQWYRGADELSGRTSATLTINPVSVSDAGTYSVVVTNAVGQVTSQSVALTVQVPPALTTSPLSQTVNQGQTVTFTAAASGLPAPTYQWLKNGAAISGATSASFVIENVQTSHAGAYSVVITNAAGNVTSASANLTVRTLPVITAQPRSQGARQGSSLTLSVSVVSETLASYQWRKDGVAIPGATSANYLLPSLTLEQAGVYTVAVINAAGAVVSGEATLTVVPIGTEATHEVAGGGYIPGGTVVISSTFTYTGTLGAAGWEVLLPDGWTFVAGGRGEGEIKPDAGQSGLLEWAWTSIPPSPVNFTYTVKAPLNATGSQAFAALVILRLDGKSYQLLAQPDPLQVNQLLHHSADTNRDFKISLLELTRVIELYNTRIAGSRTGRYKVQSGTEDGFAPDAVTAAASVTLTGYHGADTNRDGRLSLLELTRLIELYNTRTAGSRTGLYRVQSGTEDGYASGTP